MTKPILIESPPGGVAVRLLQPEALEGLHILMLHGWSGDEKVMWVLQSVLPEDAFIVAARGIYPLPLGGYHWSESPTSTDVGFEDFDPAISSIRVTLKDLKSRFGFGDGRLLFMGFSQGAALAFSAARKGIQASGVIALAGFVPFGELRGLSELPVYWGHGLRDELVPVDRAREDVKRLLDHGVEVQYCETDVGHKLGIECTRGLKEWLRGTFNA